MVLVERPSSTHRRHSLGRSRACAAYTPGNDPLPLCNSFPCWFRTGYAAGGMAHDTEPSGTVCQEIQFYAENPDQISLKQYRK